MRPAHPMLSVKNSFPLRASFGIKLWHWLSRYSPGMLEWCAVVYEAGASLRRKGYQRGWFHTHRLPKPVISVGNLTVGGTGKTPLVMWLASELHRQGKRVAILSRGYGGSRPSANRWVSDGKSFRADWHSVGDEALLMAQKCPWALIAVGKDRYRLGCWLLEQDTCDCFLLDDGFQHLSLYRDLDILLFDATDETGLKGTLPAGRMREPLSAAQWATIIMFSRTGNSHSLSSLQARIEHHVGKPIVPLRIDITPQKMIHIPTRAIRSMDFFKHRSLLLVSGIGNPSSFRSCVLSCELDVRDEIRYSDHFAYSEKDVEEIRLKMNRLKVDLVLTTEKDALKLQEFLRKDDPFWALEVQVTVAEGENQIQERLRALFPS
jgi:tetraacyldisaccharide 4'-kinase